MKNNFYVLMSTLSFCLIGINLLSYSATQNSIISELNFTIVESAFIVSSFFLAYSLTQVLGGVLSDRFGGENVICFATSATTILILLFSQIQSFESTLILRILIGVMCGLILPGCVRVVNYHLRGQNTDVANGFFAAGWGIAQVVMFYFIPYITNNFDWRNALITVGIISLVIAIYNWVIKLRTKDSSRPIINNKKVVRKYKLRDLISFKLMMIISINATGIFVPVSVLTWFPLYLNEIFGLSTYESLQLLSTLGITTIISCMLCGVISKRIGQTKVICISMTGTVIILCLLLYPINFYYVTILLLLLGFFAIFYIAPLLSLIPTATKLGKTNPGLTFGLTNTSCNFIAFFPPLVMGIIIQTYQDIMLSLMSLILFTLMGVISSLIILLRK